ncbi:hypothetical protein ACHAPT_001332 [Fusarium lateritium]
MSRLSSTSQGRYDLNEALDKLFASILNHLAETDVFGHSGSPSIFIVYAHDNEKEGTANAWCVVLLIGWLKAIRSRTVSDKAPLPLWSPRAGGSNSTRNILSNQLCLLPCTDTSGDAGIVNRVNKVVVCGSEVLRRYYQNDFTSPYIDAIVAAYQAESHDSRDSAAVESKVRNIVEANCSHAAFHHVLTELAFLKLRSIHTKENHGIVPVALDQDLMAWLPFRANCDLVMKAKSLSIPDLHQLFFKILEQIYVQEHVLIKQCKECYSQASKRFRRESILSEARCQQIIDQEIGKSQAALRGLQSAAFRSQRRDIQQLDSNQLHHSTNQSLGDMRASFKHLLEETTAIKTTLDGGKLEKLLEWLSGCPYRLHHKSVSSSLMPGSGQWLVNHSTYRAWLQSVSSSMILVHGVRGCGKSSMFSVVVDQLVLENQSSQRGLAVAFYYCAATPSEPDRASPDAILRSILRQVAVDQEKKTVNPTIWLEYEKVTNSLASRANLSRLGTYGCVELLLKLTAGRTTYLALDAIDELQEQDRFVLTQAFRRIIDESTGLVKVLITSRNDAQIESLLQSATTIRVSPAENRCDIEAFISTQLEGIVRSRRLLNGSPSKRLLERMRKTLTTGAQEMFLWVQLQIEVLCRKKTENDILTALEAGLSDNLDKIYAKTYESFLELDQTARSIVQGVFSWILYAKSSLTIEALRGALALSPDFAKQTGELALPDLFDVCYNLVVLDPTMNILRLCHPSARDFMRRQTMFSEVSGNRLLAETCLEQCSRGPGHGSEEFLGSGPISDLALYAGLYWPHHLKMAQISVPATGEAFKAMAEFVFDAETADLNIAFVWWLEWMTQALKNLPPYHALRKTHECLTSPDGPSPLFTACVFGLDSLLEVTLSHMSVINLEQLSETGHTPLYLASTFGHGSVVSKLIEHGADANVTCGSYGNPLHAACFRGHLGVVETLLKHGVSPRTRSKVFDNALHAACEGSRADIAELLIKNHTVIQDGQDYDDALQRTVEAGFRNAVEYLMGPRVAREFDRDKGAKDQSQNVILGAIKKGQVGIMQYLLSKPGMAQKLPKDAMAIAALRGHVEMLGLLHDYGIDTETEGKFGSALRSASLQGHVRSARKLLQLGADPKRTGPRGDSLQAAASKGHVEVIKLLISHGADVNQPGKPCGTCIQAAAYHGHGEAVEVLIGEGAEIYSKGKFKDALHAAVQGGHQDIASFLQENYPPPSRRGIPAIARGDEHETFWYSKLETSNRLGDQDPRSSSPHPEDTDEEGDDMGNEAAEDADDRAFGEQETEYGLTFAASIGNISTIRQELQADEVAEKEVGQALMAAAGRGNLQVTELLLEEALRHVTGPRLLKQKALLEAAKHRQFECFQMLADSLKRTVSILTWAAVLKAAAKTGDEAIATGILAFKRLRPPPDHSSSIDRIPERANYRRLKVDYPSDDDSTPDLDDERAPPSTVDTCRKAIETANSSGHHQIARLVWDWVLESGPEILVAGFHEWDVLTAAAARFADFSIFQSCFGLQGRCTDYERESHESKHDLLLNTVRGHNAVTFKPLFEIIQQGDFDSSAFFPSFMEACKQGFDTAALRLSSPDNNIVLDVDQVMQGVSAAAASGHGSLCLDLLKNLEPEGDDAINNGAITQALIAAAGAGKLAVIQYLLDHTEIQCEGDFITIMTRALVAACRSGHRKVAELCLEEGADADMAVSKVDMGELSESHDDLPPYRPLMMSSASMPTMHRGPPRGPRPQWRGAPPSGFLTLPILDNLEPPEEETQEATALQASIEAFDHLGRMRGSDSQALAQVQQQVSIVRLVLDHVSDLSERVGKHNHPLQMAVRAGNHQVVQALLENGAADGFRPRELGDLILRATRLWRTKSSIPTILELLNRGALLPPTKEGSLSDDVLGAIGDAVNLMFSSARGTTAQYFSRLFAKRGPFKSDKPARELMNNGMRQLIQIIFRRLPRQTASDGVFGELLHVAATAGDLPTVRLLIKHHVDVNHITMPNNSPLGAAAEFGHVQVTKALLRAGAHVHPKPQRITYTSWDSQEPAVKAITGKQVSALKALVDGGLDPNFKPGNDSRFMAARLKPGDDSLLVLAAQSKIPEFIKLLLKAGADPKACPKALIAATEAGSLDMVKSLLDAGADVNAMDIYGEIIKEKRLCSPLYVACEEGHAHVVRELLKCGADASLDIGDRDGLPIVVAARHGQSDIVEALLEASACPTRRSQGLKAAPFKFRSPLVERDVERDLGAPVSRSGGQRFQDAPMTDSKFIDLQADDRVYLNAVESASTGQKGARAGLQTLSLLLEAIDDFEQRQAACLQAMAKASNDQNSRILEGLLEYIPPNSVALDYACRCGSVRAVENILEQGASVNATLSEGQVPLQLAIDHGHSGLMQLLVANGANLKSLQDKGLPLNLYCLVASVIKSYAFITPPERRSITRVEQMVQHLLQVAQDCQPVTEPDQYFLDRSLILACHVGSVEMASSLLDLGARLDSATDLSRHIPNYYPSPFFAAIEGNQPRILKYLLRWDSDTNAGASILVSSEAVLEACLGKSSPVLLQTFLEHVDDSFEIPEEHLFLAIRKEKWHRPWGESDLEIILEYCPYVIASEDLLAAFSGPPWRGAIGELQQGFFKPWLVKKSGESSTTTIAHIRHRHGDRPQPYKGRVLAMTGWKLSYEQLEGG